LRSRPTRPRIGLDRVDQRLQLRDIVVVAGGQRDARRNAAGVRQDVELAARARTVYLGRLPGVEAPDSARMWLESMTARCQSISPARS
jgi:hypothetical protein